MIKATEKLEKFERELGAKTILNYNQALQLFEGLWKEALHLGVINLANYQENLKKEIEIARTLNFSKKSNV